MANIKSQIKRNRQNERRRLRNQAVRSQLKTLTRSFRRALASGEREAAQEAFRRVCRAYDRAAGQGVVHRNNAANHKARLTKAFNAAFSAAA